MQVSSSARCTAPCTPSARRTCRCPRSEPPQHSYDSRLDPHCYSQRSRRPSPSARPARCRTSGRLCSPLVPTRACRWPAACDWRSRSPTWRRQPPPCPANVPLNPSLTLRDSPSRTGSCRLTVSGDPTPGGPSAPASGSRLIVERLTFYPPSLKKDDNFFFLISTFSKTAGSVQFFTMKEEGKKKQTKNKNKTPLRKRGLSPWRWARSTTSVKTAYAMHTSSWRRWRPRCAGARWSLRGSSKQSAQELEPLSGPAAARETADKPSQYPIWRLKDVLGIESGAELERGGREKNDWH